jgi:hypothetical protein
MSSTPRHATWAIFGPFLVPRNSRISGQASPSPVPSPALGVVILEPCQGASGGTENYPAPNDPKLGRLPRARQGLVRVPESNTKYGGKGENQGSGRCLDWRQVSVSPHGFGSEKNRFRHPDPGFVPLFTGQLFIVPDGLLRKDSREATGMSGQACPLADGRTPE